MKKSDTMTKLVLDICKELEEIQDAPIKPSKKLRKLAMLRKASKERFEAMV